jgi:hypothetical protein
MVAGQATLCGANCSQGARRLQWDDDGLPQCIVNFFGIVVVLWKAYLALGHTLSQFSAEPHSIATNVGPRVGACHFIFVRHVRLTASGLDRCFDGTHHYMQASFKLHGGRASLSDDKRASPEDRTANNKEEKGAMKGIRILRQASVIYFSGHTFYSTKFHLSIPLHSFAAS